MTAKCEIFLNCIRNFIGIAKTKYDFQIGILKDHRCERKNMAYECKIF